MLGTDRGAPPPGPARPTLDRALVDALAGLSLAQVAISNRQQEVAEHVRLLTGVTVAGVLTTVGLLVGVLVAVLVR